MTCRSVVSCVLCLVCRTQWTTDSDVEKAISQVGVSDLLEVRFHENRANGQSKGFCVITVGSEHGARTCMEKLPKRELHGQMPIVTFASKQALNQVYTPLGRRRRKQRNAPVPDAINSTTTTKHQKRLGDDLSRTEL